MSLALNISDLEKFYNDPDDPILELFKDNQTGISGKH